MEFKEDLIKYHSKEILEHLENEWLTHRPMSMEELAEYPT